MHTQDVDGAAAVHGANTMFWKILINLHYYILFSFWESGFSSATTVTETFFSLWCIFVHFISILWYFQAGKATETSPSDATDRFRRAAFRSIASLSSFIPCQLPEPAGTQHTKETGFLQAKDVYTLPFLLVVAGEAWQAPSPVSGAGRRNGRRPLPRSARDT